MGVEGHREECAEEGAGEDCALAGDDARRESCALAKVDLESDEDCD